MWFTVDAIRSHARGCRKYAYTYHSETRAAFYSNCAAWGRFGRDFVFFYVIFNSVTRDPVPFNLRNFVLVTRDGRSIAPIDVRRIGARPPIYLPQRTSVAPFTTLSGYLIFDGRGLGGVPHMISYRDADQTLSQVFRGELTHDEGSGPGIAL